ncbi:hypothetical protein FEF26_04330 [Nesterenkonia salmonea]|uniref:DUF4345 domain-containing protein n=1 Tax=Nesterenkonia salmonea TaxID=1804987 RepID=A0A5R9BFD5_9MICC|nr:hypothetical protein [Nesterenkonia salmonea]TLP98630.1 hypothetical protein FEF26_04330 [Nesterenkonia salmonea]
MPTSQTVNKDLLSGAVTIVLSVFTLGTGLYFMVLRPPLLPEDIRFSGIDTTTLPPAFLEWLGVVFPTWGRFITGFGIVLLGIGIYLLSARILWLYLGTAAGILVAFGRFLYSNIAISSDFVWFIAAMFVLALTLAVVLMIKRGR